MIKIVENKSNWQSSYILYNCNSLLTILFYNINIFINICYSNNMHYKTEIIKQDKDRMLLESNMVY